VNPNQPDENDVTPLWLAASQGHERLVKLLLNQEGINPNRSNKHGVMLLSQSYQEGTWRRNEVNTSLGVCRQYRFAAVSSAMNMR